MKTLLIILLQVSLMDNVDFLVPSFFQPQAEPIVADNQWFDKSLTIPQDKTRYISEPDLISKPQLSVQQLYFKPIHSPIQRQGSFQNNRYGIVPEGIKLKPGRTRGKRIYPFNQTTKYRGSIPKYEWVWKGPRPISI
ncbi:MAG: hypothetical protein Tsb0034_09960 [Ekhidna sp.]